MYGMVLMAALATTPEAPSFGWGKSGAGCTGYSNSCYGSSCLGSSCIGSSCFGSSCFGSSCFGGCYGSSCGGVMFPRLRAVVGGLFHGCTGSCYGSSCYGSSCTGSCFGSSCLGSCYGSIPVYASPSYKAPPVPAALAPAYPMPYSYGGYRSSGCYGGPIYYGPDFHPPFTPCCEPALGTVVTPPQVKIDNSGTGTEVTRAKPQAAPARLTLELPADAKLYVDGTLTKGDGTSRNFHTPDLPNGQTFYYELKAEITVDGQPLTETMTVLVKAGDASTRSFGKLLAAVNKRSDALAKK